MASDGGWRTTTYTLDPRLCPGTHTHPVGVMPSGTIAIGSCGVCGHRSALTSNGLIAAHMPAGARP